jgi:UPF0716 protein FxsA
MFAALALLIIGAVLEIYVFVQVAQAIGVLNAIGILLLLSLAGAWLAKREGFLVLSRMREQLDAGRTPTNEVIDGGLVLAGGLLLLVPGFVTDAFGLLLIFPPTRARARTILRRRLHFVAVGRLGSPPPGRAPDSGEPPDDVIDV